MRAEDFDDGRKPRDRSLSPGYIEYRRAKDAERDEARLRQQGEVIGKALAEKFSATFTPESMASRMAEIAVQVNPPTGGRPSSGTHTGPSPLARTPRSRSPPSDVISDANIRWLEASLDHKVTFNDKSFNGVVRMLTDNGKATGQKMNAFIERHSPDTPPDRYLHKRAIQVAKLVQSAK